MQTAYPYETEKASPSQLTPFHQQMVLTHLKLVKWVVRRISSHLPSHIDQEDLNHSGILGLIDAVQRFPWDKDKPAEEFTAYAECRIRGQVMDELRRLDVLPRSARKKANEYKRANELLRQQLKREPTDTEMSQHLNVDLDTYQRMRAEASVGGQVSFSPTSTAGDMEEILLKTLNVTSPNTPEALLHIEEIKRILKEEIERLTERERQVISLYYVEELTLKEIGEVQSITESRVSQIHSQTVNKLMQRLKKVFLREELFLDTL